MNSEPHELFDSSLTVERYIINNIKKKKKKKDNNNTMTGAGLDPATLSGQNCERHVITNYTNQPYY